MSDRNQEAVQFLKSLEIKTTAMGGFNKGATFAALEQLSDIYEAAMEALRAELLEKETALQEQQKQLTAQIGEAMLQREQERREILAQAKSEAAQIVESAKDTALRRSAQSLGGLEQMRKDKSLIISELKLIREQINQTLEALPGQAAAPERSAASERTAAPERPAASERPAPAKKSAPHPFLDPL